MKFIAKNPEREEKRDVQDELRIDPHRLNEELMDQPLYYRKWSEMLAGVAKKAKLAKLVLEEKKAEKHIQYSQDGMSRKVKEVESAVLLDADVKKLERELIDAEELVEKFSGILRAFHQRAEALKDLNANKRKELID